MARAIKDSFSLIEIRDSGEQALVRPLSYFKTPNQGFYQTLFPSVEEMREVCRKKFLAEVTDCGSYLSFRFKSISDAKNCVTFLNKKLTEKKDALQSLLNQPRPLTIAEQTRNKNILETEVDNS